MGHTFSGTVASSSLELIIYIYLSGFIQVCAVHLHKCMPIKFILTQPIGAIQVTYWPVKLIIEFPGFPLAGHVQTQ